MAYDVGRESEAFEEGGGTEMFVQQFFTPGLAHSSYLLAGPKTCAIVDPRRDVQVYLDAAHDLNLTITHVLETHLHADFVSGHVDLAEATGAAIYAPKAGRCRFDHVALKEGDSFEIEDLTVSVLETPGHTPEHISYVVTDRSRGAEPAAVFCGDTLFVGDVGRPDLFPGKARRLASQLYDSLHGKLLKLPGFCQVYPAHGAGSLCGRSIGAMRTSTIGYERKCNAPCRMRSRERFIESLTTNMPPAPDHFSRCSAVNAAGPALVRTLPGPAPMAPARFARRARRRDTVVLDVRRPDAFGAQHVPGAFNVGLAGNLATFAGWVLPPDADILLVVGAPDDAAQAAMWLRRVGLDRPVGYLEGGMAAWVDAGLPVQQVPQLSVHELRRQMTEGSGMQLCDVRSKEEHARRHIEGSVHIPVQDTRTRYGELASDVPVVVMCGTGYRSSLAASILQRNGVEQVSNCAGGMTAYAAAGYGPDCPHCVAPHLPRSSGT